MNFGVSRFRRLLPVACASLALTNLSDLADSMIAGHLLGETALGAVELAWPVIELVFFLGSTVANGTAIRHAEAVGAYDRERAGRIFSSGLFLVLGLGLAVTAALAALRGPFCAFIGAGPETAAFVVPYWKGLLLYPVFSLLNVYLMTLVCADGDTRLCTLSFVADFVVNVVATGVLCRFFGAVGCSLGLVCGAAAGVLALLPHFAKPSSSLRFTPCFSPRDSAAAFATAFPASSAVLFTSVVYVFMNKVLVGRLGDSALVVMAVVSVANNLMLFLFGVPNAAQPVVGVYRTEGNVRAISRVMTDALVMSAALGAALSLVLVTFPALPAALVGVADPENIALAKTAVRIIGASYAFYGVGTLFYTYYLFVGRPGASMTLTTLQELVFPLAGCLAGLACGGFAGFCWGYAVAPLAALGVFFALVAMCRKGRVDPFLLDRSSADAITDWSVVVDEKSACATAMAVHAKLEAAGASMKTVVRADMLVEDALMIIKSRNPGRKVRAEVTLDLRRGVKLVFRDDGKVVSSFTDGGDDWFRAQTLGAVVSAASGRNSAVTNGYNRNEYTFSEKMV